MHRYGERRGGAGDRNNRGELLRMSQRAGVETESDGEGFGRAHDLFYLKNSQTERTSSFLLQREIIPNNPSLTRAE